MEHFSITNRLRRIGNTISELDRGEDKPRDTRENPTIKRTRVDNMIVNDYEQSKRAKILEAVRTRTITNRFTDIANVTLNETETITNWPDTQPGKMITFELVRRTIDRENVLEAARIFSHIFTALSERTVASLLSLAYNLRNASGAYVFNDPDERLIDMSLRKDIIEFSDKISRHREASQSTVQVNVDLDDEESLSNLMNSCCFLAASYLRMYTRDAQNYLNVEARLKSTYLALYNKELALSNFHPSLTTLQRIKAIFENDVIKNTFYVLLYAGETLDIGMDLKDFLYRKHISYAGLHAYTLFMRVAEAYHIDNNTLTKALYTRLYKRELDALQALMNECVMATSETEKRVMWKYARIFDRRFCSTLQTKNCPSFVATLAFLLKKEVPSRENEDVLRITHVSKLPQESLDYSERYATVVREFLVGKRTI